MESMDAGKEVEGENFMLWTCLAEVDTHWYTALWPFWEISACFSPRILMNFLVTSTDPTEKIV